MRTLLCQFSCDSCLKVEAREREVVREVECGAVALGGGGRGSGRSGGCVHCRRSSKISTTSFRVRTLPNSLTSIIRTEMKNNENSLLFDLDSTLLNTDIIYYLSMSIR